MARTRRNAGKGGTTTGRDGVRTRKSAARKTTAAASVKRKPARSAARKPEPSPSSEIASLKMLLQAARLQQEASAEILRAVANAAGDAAGPLQLIAETTARLFGPASVSIQLAKGSEFTQEYRVGAIAQRIGSAYPRSNIRVGGRNLPGTVVADNRQIHIPDLDHLDPAMSDFPGLPHARAGGARTVCGTPLRREGKAIGVLIVFRDRLAPFTADELALQQAFADQAVIAIENARLFNETRDALERQTATSDILRIINQSPSDVTPVFDAIAERARVLCGALLGATTRFDGELLHLVGYHGVSPQAEAVMRSSFPRKPDLSSINGRCILAKGPVQIADVELDPHYQLIAAAKAADYRALVAVPMLQGQDVIGVIAVTRKEPGEFSGKLIELLQTFADQAVIAVENARLFDEVQAKTRDLEEALQQQTATADVLKVISRSAFDLQTVFDTLLTSAARLIGASNGALCVRAGDVFPYRATIERNPEWTTYLQAHPARAGRHSISGRVILSGQVETIADVRKDAEYDHGYWLEGHTSMIGVPLLRSGKVEGVFSLARPIAGPFTPREIELVRTFADQALIAIENTRLFDQVQERTRELATSLNELRAAQDRLIQTEKLASLGQLTAGIAHEIKNPLNFVNNFSALSAELVDELTDMLTPAALDEAMRAGVDEVTGLLKDNLGKVVQHGRRADSIIRNMLLHSREGSGEHRAADINALVDESLNLAYHGARAEKPQFEVTLQRNLDPQAGLVEVFPQEITRVLLNLIANGFYAVTKRKADKGADFEPLVIATTRGRDDHVEIRIRDNGTGIPPEVKEKMFNPFFTTKPAGEGTGLGLSMSHDIIVKQHGGSIEVVSEPGVFTEFIVTLQRKGSGQKTRGETR